MFRIRETRDDGSGLHRVTDHAFGRAADFSRFIFVCGPLAVGGRHLHRLAASDQLPPRVYGPQNRKGLVPIQQAVLGMRDRLLLLMDFGRKLQNGDCIAAELVDMRRHPSTHACIGDLQAQPVELIHPLI